MSFLRRILSRTTINRFLKDSQKVTKNVALIQTASTESLGSNQHWKYFILLASGYLTYKVIKENAQVYASSTFEGHPLAGRRKMYNFIADVVENSAPAVVYIEIKDTRRVDFFTGRPLTISNGSGFIVKEDGLIVTNAHVVTNKPHARVEVKLLDGKIYTGVVENIDLKSDLATVRIPANKLPVMKLGSSADLKPGEFVVAIGSPLSLSNTVTTGVVSSTNRGSEELGLQGKDMVYIQTDAAITFGNSGGPLVNLDGEAIGVNSMKVTAGISFAIPIDYVKEFLKATEGKGRKDSGVPKRLYMGITMLTLTPQLIYELHQRNHMVPNDVQSGVLVWKVIIGSPAHSGGVQPGDIVTHIDGKPIKNANDVYSILSNESHARSLRLSVNRQGRQMDLVIEPEDYNSS